MKSKRNVVIAGFVVVGLLALVLVCWLLLVEGQGSAPKSQAVEKAKPVLDPLIVRGMELAKAAPQSGTVEWMNWYKGLSAEDRHAWSVAEDARLTPPEPTQVEKGGISVKTWNEGRYAFPVKMLTNYKPLLRIGDDVSVRPLQVKTVRGSQGIVTTIWARRAKNSLVVDWSKNSVAEGSVDNSVMGFGLTPQHIRQNTNVGASLGALRVRNNLNAFNTKWERKSTVFALAIDEDYPFAFGLERNESKKPFVVDAVVAIDVKNKKVMDIVSIPEAPMGVHVAFETDKDCLLVVESAWNWIMLIDLKSVNSNE